MINICDCNNTATKRLGRALEVEEDTDSKYKIEPRKYRISHYWNDIFQILAPMMAVFPDYDMFVKELRISETRQLTILVSEMTRILCYFILKESIVYPETLSGI